MWVRVALSITVILVIVCSLPIVTPLAVIPGYVRPNSVSKLVETGNVLHPGGDKCVPVFMREGDGFDD